MDRISILFSVMLPLIMLLSKLGVTVSILYF